MNLALKNALSAIIAFLSKRANLALLFVSLICIFALADYINLGLTRKTIVFYSEIEGNIVVEDRMLHRSGDQETDIRRYIEEVLLGPFSPGLEPLFLKETRLNSFMYRENVAYADLSQTAALPLPDGRAAFSSLLTLNRGIRRNFPYVKDVKLFIAGNEIFFEEFHGIFANSVDNGITAP